MTVLVDSSTLFPLRRRWLGTEPIPSKAVGRDYSQCKIDYVSRFQDLVRRWREDTAASSSAAEMMEHSAFQEIVNMQDAAIPLIVSEIRRRPDFLFLALHKITNENPVPPTAIGKIDKIVEAWLRWAERKRIREY